jgi:hypothetical protein
MAGFDLENLAHDPESLAKAFEAIESGEDLASSEPEPTEPAAEPKEPAKAEPEQSNTQQDNQDDAEPEGVATKDGKRVIPYAVLKSERERASRAEQVAEEMRARVASLEAMVKAASEGAKTGESARTEIQEGSVSDLSQEDLDVLKEDFPTVYKAVMASMAAAKALEAKLQPVEETVREARQEQQRTEAETVQDAIDSVPKLAHIQANNAEAFELAKQFDATLRNQAAWANRPLVERFEKVTEMVEAALGKIDIPGAKTELSPEDLKKAAAAKAAAATKANKSNVPTSLSEFPVGEPAAADERAAAETMTHAQLAELLSSMTPEQMDAYFQSL